MTLFEHLARQARLPRAIFFTACAVMAVAMLWKPDHPVSQLISAFSAVLLVASLLLAYRQVRCPRCQARLWRTGMGMVPPRIGATPQVGACTGCGLDYDAQVGEGNAGTPPSP